MRSNQRAHCACRFERPLGELGSDTVVVAKKEKMRSIFSSLLRGESAVTSIEYAMLGGLIAVVIVVGVTQLGDHVRLLYEFVKVAVAATAAAA